MRLAIPFTLFITNGAVAMVGTVVDRTSQDPWTVVPARTAE